MVYQKKMLILSGDGKGVVMIEKNGGGTTFSLRTFDLRAYSSPLKVGIVTRSHVAVRDLPAGDDPALFFSLDVGDISELHFAVFDDGLRLYGATAKRMWEANLMDLLSRHDRKPSLASERPTPPALPPLSPKPEVLPLPDGTGIPQTRLALYGDEAIAESNFYTAVDMSARMPVVESFLDSPRVLDDRIAPRVEPHIPSPPEPAESAPLAEQAASFEADSVAPNEPIEPVEPVAFDPATDASARPTETEEVEEDAEQDIANAEEPRAEIQEIAAEAEEQKTEAYNEKNTEAVEAKPQSASEEGALAYADDAAQTGSFSSTEKIAPKHMPNPTVIPDTTDMDRAPVPEPMPALEFTPAPVAELMPTELDLSAEAAAVAETTVTAETATMPWEMEAIWLKKRSRREPAVVKREVKPIRAAEQIKRLRECTFFERVRADVQTLFASAPKDEELNGLLSDLEWVRVDFDGKRISVGRSGNSVLCYAVSGGYERNSPLGGEAQWLPTDRNTPTGKGYWLIFQNMTTGEIIEN